MIILNHRDPRPIYEQLKDKLRTLILSGAVKTGERLLSVRELAAELAINPNTIQRAYRELESEGFLYSVAGKGSFAAPLNEVDEGRKKDLTARLKEAAAELHRLGATEAELRQMITEVCTDD